MDLEKLKSDWATDPGLRPAAFSSVEELAAHLRKCHELMMEGGAGCFGYLYRQQTLRVRELTKEIENGGRERKTGRG